MARCPLRADEVAGHERLAVPGRECVGSAPERRDQQRHEDHAEREVAPLDEGLEPAAAMLRSRGPADRGGRGVAGSRPVGDGGPADVERRAQEAARVGAELVRPARRRRRARHDARAVTSADDDLSPADATLEGMVGEGQLRPVRRGAVDRVEAHRLQPAGARSLRCAVGEGDERHADAVDAQLELPREQGGVAGAADLGTLLERRDLGEVERVADVDRVAGEVDGCEVIHGEVAERVCRGARRHDEDDERRREREDDCETGLHRSAFRATGAQRIEKCGLSASAREKSRRAAAPLRRQRSIIPWWKIFRASRVPRRSARDEYGSASPQRPLRARAHAEDVVAVDRGPVGASLACEVERMAQADPVVDVEERRLQVGLDAVCDEQALDHVDERVLLVRLRRPAGHTIEVAELRDVLRQRNPVDGLLLERDRGPVAALGSLDRGRARRARSGSRGTLGARRDSVARRLRPGRSTSRACRAGSASTPPALPVPRRPRRRAWRSRSRRARGRADRGHGRRARTTRGRASASPSCRTP